jgi:hypothetical protein
LHCTYLVLRALLVEDRVELVVLLAAAAHDGAEADKCVSAGNSLLKERHVSVCVIPWARPRVCTCA